MNRPLFPHLFSMTWRVGLFVHWPFDPDDVRPHVPGPLELDTRDGRAWVSLLPFVLARVGLRGTPRGARLTFPEVNVRTYVRLNGRPGLYFFAVDVDQRLLARLARTTRLPVHDLDATVRVGDDGVRFRSVRERDGARLDASYRPEGEPFRADPGSLDHWLAERRRLYDPGGRGVLSAEIAHEPWPLQPATATIRRNGLLSAAGLPAPADEPVVRYSDDLTMTGSVPRVLRPRDRSARRPEPR